MLPWIILAIAAFALLVIGLGLMRRTKAVEHVPGETDADRERTEQEFEEAERYQAEWREEQHKHQNDTRIP